VSHDPDQRKTFYQSRKVTLRRNELRLKPLGTLPITLHNLHRNLASHGMIEEIAHLSKLHKSGSLQESFGDKLIQ
jgi:hypothetical protein